MVDTARLQAAAEEAEIQSEMAKSRLAYVQTSRAALTRRWDDAQEKRRAARQSLQDSKAVLTRGQPEP
jgi:hypothetical protein